MKILPFSLSCQIYQRPRKLVMYDKNSAIFVVMSDLSKSLKSCHVQQKFRHRRRHVRSFKFLTVRLVQKISAIRCHVRSIKSLKCVMYTESQPFFCHVRSSFHKRLSCVAKIQPFGVMSDLSNPYHCVMISKNSANSCHVRSTKF